MKIASAPPLALGPLSSAVAGEAPPSLYLERFEAQHSGGRDNLVTLARLATLVYLNPQRQQEIASHQPETRSFQVLDSKDNARLGCQAKDTGTQVAVLETADALLVAPRGTPLSLTSDPATNLQMSDLLNDLNAFPTQNYTHTGLVHGGFKQAADGIWEQLKPILEHAQKEHKEIHLAGHSLGAAISLNLADRMHGELHELPRSVVTLGGPAIGWRGEQRHLTEIGLAERTTRLVNNIDPVAAAIPGGRQIGKEIYFDSAGVGQVNPERHDTWKGLKQALTHFHFNPLQTHYPKVYLEHLQDPLNAAALNR